MEQSSPMIQVNHLCKSFGSLEVLKDISTTFERGSVAAIIGPSGGGKSTFLRCLNLLEKPTSGEIIFDGVNICDKKTDINLHRQKIGMVFQQFNLFNNMNVLKNLTAAPVKIKGMVSRRGRGKGGKAAHPGRPCRQAHCLPCPAFGRTEAAGGNSPRAHDESRGDAV